MNFVTHPSLPNYQYRYCLTVHAAACHIHQKMAIAAGEPGFAARIIYDTAARSSNDQVTSAGDCDFNQLINAAVCWSAAVCAHGQVCQASWDWGA